jgi:hypothetical protein
MVQLPVIGLFGDLNNEAMAWCAQQPARSSHSLMAAERTAAVDCDSNG